MKPSTSRTMSKFYELIPTKNNVKKEGMIIFYRRVLVGRSDNCDIAIPSSSVSAIHAIIEISDDGGRIYDMNSKAGTFVNGSKIICQDIKVGDKISFGAQEFTFKEYKKSSSLPPVLDAVGPEGRTSFEQQMTGGAMPVPPRAAAPELSEPSSPPSVKKLPEGFDINPAHIITDDSSEGTPYISYPLAKDPKAEFSEYIFEDADHIYPIFKWSIEKMAAEVIILYHDQIFSVDYLPSRKDIYYVKGLKSSRKNVEFSLFTSR